MPVQNPAQHGNRPLQEGRLNVQDYVDSSASHAVIDVTGLSVPWPLFGSAEGGSTRARQFRLTARQAEILLLISQGLPTKLISRHLNITAGTVKVHISAILRELGVTNRLQAVLAGQRYGLLPRVEMHESC